MTRLAMSIDLDRCVGCNTCVAACKIKNATPPGVFWLRLESREAGVFPDLKLVNVPIQCMHCAKPACVQVCPTDASFKRHDGIVAVDSELCLGCGTCVDACPYGARTIKNIKSYHPDSSMIPFETAKYATNKDRTATKCNFCVDLIERGQEPVCVTSCPSAVRCFGDLDNPDSHVSRIVREKHARPLSLDNGAEPSIFYVAEDATLDVVGLILRKEKA